MTRFRHYSILTAVAAALTLPNLGAPSLWDMDEGVNAECGREMREIGTWVVPTYNYELRTAKPVMLYWLHRVSYALFGVNEWAARFPSVVATLGTVLVVYELGRRMFGAATGLLAGVIVASAVEVCKLAHAATPDAVFVFFNTLCLTLFYVGSADGRRWWFVPAGAAAGLAVLTKGPAGVALPGVVIVAYLLWNREVRTLLDRRLIWGGLAFLLVAVPWYAFVTAETRGAYARAFFGTENVGRFLQPMENHRGPVWYYVVALFAFFAPWSVFLLGAVWYGVKEARTPERPTRFLLCWAAVYLVFFSAAATKLPNYIAPLYPAVALLTARFLTRWAESHVTPARWVMPAAAAGLLVVGVVVGVGMAVVSGTLPLPLKGLRLMPALAPWAAVGLIPAAGAATMAYFLVTQSRPNAVRAVAVTSVAFVAVMAAFPPAVVDSYKAPKRLVADAGAFAPARDVRLASLDYTQESVTFYAERKVDRLTTPKAAADFLALPRPAYLFVPAKVWDEHLAATPNVKIAARRYDFYRNADILVVTNEGASP